MDVELFRSELEGLFDEWRLAHKSSAGTPSANYCLGHVDALYSVLHLLEKHLTKGENK